MKSLGILTCNEQQCTDSESPDGNGLAAGGWRTSEGIDRRIVTTTVEGYREMGMGKIEKGEKDVVNSW